MDPRLLSVAEEEVLRALHQLPPDVRRAAEECSTHFELGAEAALGEEGIDEDLLGLFDGYNRLEAGEGLLEDMPRIRLFLDNLWDYCGEDEMAYRREVRITFLHELGHYLGWDEDQVEALGLG